VHLRDWQQALKATRILPKAVRLHRFQSGAQQRLQELRWETDG